MALNAALVQSGSERPTLQRSAASTSSMIGTPYRGRLEVPSSDRSDAWPTLAGHLWLRLATGVRSDWDARNESQESDALVVALLLGRTKAATGEPSG